MEIQQSPLYAEYIKKLHWTVIKLQGYNIFIKQFPLYGGLAKLQRFSRLVDPQKLIALLKDYHVRRVIVEPDANVDQQRFSEWINQIGKSFAITKSPYLPTKTIRIDLTAPEDKIFKRFSEAKRRAVRRAIKHHVLIKESPDIHALINIKNKSAGFFGSITTYGIDKLWFIFAPQHASILLAHTQIPIPYTLNPKLSSVGGILLLFYDSVAYYWIAGATRKGKKLFAPTLLVWEALKLSKKRGCKQFDFVGVWDERMPKQFHEWKGFTKFKEGFGGEPFYYSIVQK